MRLSVKMGTFFFQQKCQILATPFDVRLPSKDKKATRYKRLFSPIYALFAMLPSWTNAAV